MYKIAVAGCGIMSDTWIKVASSRKDCQIVALVDTNGGEAKLKKEKHALNCNAYTALATALDKEDVNLVFDITPPENHFGIVTTALKAGCNVFGEKPMSDTLENAEKMVQCSDDTKKEYFVMQNRRYIPGICAMKNFLQANEIGNIGQLSANFQLNPHFGGFRENMDSPLIADMAIHTFDAARYILGQNAKSVYCHEFNPSWSWYKGNANAVCIFVMENGSVFDYRGSWCANGLITSWESEWHVSGVKGCVYWDGAAKLFYNSDTGNTKTGISDSEVAEASERNIAPLAMDKTAHAGCISEMFDALGKGKRPQTDCRDNINSIRMVYKAIESAKIKKAILL